MASRFHTDNVAMIGVDIHDCDGAPSPFAVGKAFNWPGTNGKIAPTVTGYAHPLVQETFKMYVVPHVPLIPPQTGKGAADVAWANAEGSSMCILGVSSVTSGGLPLACSRDEAWGLNLNCQSAGGISAKGPTGVTSSYYPLLTNPTDADLMRMMLRGFYEAAFGAGAKGFSKQLTKSVPLQKYVKNFGFDDAKKRLDQEFDKHAPSDHHDTHLE